jgi:hypothetical protein
MGGVVAVLVYLLITAVFVARLGGNPGLERIFGLVLILLVFPLTYLFLAAFSLNRPKIYVL